MGLIMTGRFFSVSIPKERNFLLSKHGQSPEHYFLSFALSPVYSNETDQENHDNVKSVGSGGTFYMGSYRAHNAQTGNSTSSQFQDLG